MDGERFDSLTRSVAAAATTRRTALRGFSGGILAGLFALPDGDEAAAKCVKLGKDCRKAGKKLKCCGGAQCKGRCKCPAGKKPCGGDCIPATTCCTDANCVTGRRCCKGVCTVVQNCCADEDCLQGELCVQGQCVIGRGDCPAGADNCVEQALCMDARFCECATTMAGATRCAGTQLIITCNNCTRDADCASFGPGAFCRKDTGPACQCQPGVGFCQLPCGSAA